MFNNYAGHTDYYKSRKTVRVLTKETARIVKTQDDKVRILIYEVSKENWGNAGILGLDMK